MSIGVVKTTSPKAMPTHIAILGAGIFVRTQYIPRLREIGDCVIIKAIWSRSEVNEVILPFVVLGKRL